MQRFHASRAARRFGPWMLAAPWLIWAAGRTLGLDRGFPLVPLASFTPYVAASAVLPLLVALALRRWYPALLSAVALVVLLVAVVPRAVPDAAAGDRSGPSLRLLTANLLRGKADPSRLVDLVRERRVDVLAVQELTPGAVRRLRAAGLGELLPHSFLATQPSVYGSGIYSRHPLRPRGAPALPFRTPRARLRLPGDIRLDVVSVHPYPPTGPDAVADWEAALRSLPGAGSGTPGVLLGDFNATLDHRELRRLLDRGWEDAGDATGEGLTPTWHAGQIWPPPLTIDHVLVDERLGVSDYEVLDLAGSDHRAVYAEAELGNTP